MTGSIVTFNDAIPFTPIEKLIAQINPVQDLHGQDAPYPPGGGKNLVMPVDNISANVTCTANANGSVTCTGLSNGTTRTSTVWRGTLEPGTYTASGVSGGSNDTYAMRISKNSASNPLETFYNGSYTFTLAEAAEIFIVLRFSATQTTAFNVTFWPMIEKGSTETTFAPYSNICPISGWTELNAWLKSTYEPTAEPQLQVSWQDTAGTVYGGNLIINKDGSCTLTVDKYLYVYDGTESFAKSSTALNGFYNNLTATSRPHDCPKMIDYNLTNTGITNECSSMFIPTRDPASYRNNYGLVFLDSGHNFNVPPETFGTTISSFKAKLAELYEAGNPVSVFCKIAEPIVYILQSVEMLSTVLGTNNIWCDTGDVTVTYQSTDSGLPLGYSFGSPLGEYNPTNLHLFNETFIENGMGD